MNSATNSKTHLTAIVRHKLSSPARWLDQNNRVIGRWLDYGCGRGYDAEALNGEKYDPHYSSEMPEGEFDTILCSFVLNVLLPEQREGVIQDVLSKLRSGGKAYFTVRRDIDGPMWSGLGTFQDRVILAAPFRSVKHKRRSYEIYEVTK